MWEKIYKTCVDGCSMSRLDKFLLSEAWCFLWTNCVHVALVRGLSDHYPILLTVYEKNWGPRPLRILKCGANFPGYTKFVVDKLNLVHVLGWGGYVLKRKVEND
jgi:hypothetical protein